MVWSRTGISLTQTQRGRGAADRHTLRRSQGNSRKGKNTSNSDFLADFIRKQQKSPWEGRAEKQTNKKSQLAETSNERYQPILAALRSQPAPTNNRPAAPGRLSPQTAPSCSDSTRRSSRHHAAVRAVPGRGSGLRSPLGARVPPPSPPPRSPQAAARRWDGPECGAACGRSASRDEGAAFAFGPRAFRAPTAEAAPGAAPHLAGTRLSGIRRRRKGAGSAAGGEPRGAGPGDADGSGEGGAARIHGNRPPARHLPAAPRR